MSRNKQNYDPSKYVGKKYGKYTVLKYSHFKTVNGYTNIYTRYYLCRCECGDENIIDICNLLSGASKGCHKCRTPLIPRQYLTKRPLYRIWSGMMQRCYNENNDAYENYGGRGIQVCKEWHDFRVFEKDMSPRPEGLSIDRIDNDGNYSKENCRWATPKMQMANTRSSKLLTASKLAKITGLSRERIRQLTHFSDRKPLQKFIKEKIQTKERVKIIYNESAIEFIKNKLYLKINSV